MNPRILKANSLNEYLTAERCFIAENYSASNGKVSIARAKVNPGVTTKAHHLEGIEEIYIIVEGKGAVNIEGLEQTEVNGGDVVIIPAGTSPTHNKHWKNRPDFLLHMYSKIYSRMLP